MSSFTDHSPSDKSSSSIVPGVREVRFEHTPDFPRILEHLNASILVTTYQAGKLLVLGTKDGKLSISFLDYDQPMGLAVSADGIAIGTRRQVHFLVPAHETQSDQTIYDGCFVPRSSFYTGSIHGHDLAWGSEGLWVVNTLFSCLTTLHDDFSFVPRWRPPFISQLTDQDRCHLNGLAMEDSKPKFVTAMDRTDSPGGWRPGKATNGVILEVPNGEIVCHGLSMPHSPRLHAGRLWVLNSGYGSMGCVDPATGTYQAVALMPGYTRGLSFQGQFAFVGLSKIRETAIFGGVPIAEHRSDLRCGVGVVDISTGKTVAVFQFHSGVSEIFAVEVLPNFCNPLIAGASVNQNEREVWIVPAEGSATPKPKLRYSAFANNNTIRADAQVPEPTAADLVNLGNIRQDQGHQSAALICYQRALETDQHCVAALQNLGYLLFNMGEAEKARDVYESLIALQPTPLNHLLASSVLPVVYDSAAEVEYWRDRQLQILRKLAASGSHVDATKSLVPTCFFAAYQGLCNREVMELRGRAIKGKDFTAKRKTRSDSKSSRGDNRLRVGFLSAYFRDHTIGRLNIGRLERLCRDHIHLTVIYAASGMDALTSRFAATADRFVQLPRDLSTAIDRLNTLELDVLVHADVGMDSLTQTLAFSRFAPVQVATWGHPDTTGSEMIDYFVSSKELEIESSDSDYSERLIRLPSLGIDYERPVIVENGRTREQLGLPKGRNLYTCPQTLFKFHPDFDSIMAAILTADPNGEIILLQGRLPHWTNELKRRLRRTLPERGGRVRFLPAMRRNDFLSLLQCSDVLLDPIHFGSGNSALEAMAIGTPLITIDGKFLRSRIASAIYKQMNLLELIAPDPDAYCRLAVKIACDQAYNNRLRERILELSKPLFGDTGAARQWEQCLLQMKAIGDSSSWIGTH